MPNNRSRIAVFVFVLVVLVGMISACSSATTSATPIPPSPQPTVRATPTAIPQPTAAAEDTSIPPVQFEEGKELVNENCTGCHNLDRISSAHKTRAQWGETIDRMITC